ncbi:hypothetical protein CHS0354_009615 [Potamilus streckersoni]|uniref:Uncharacterized protein n=1 Tax=Potamilus streckersoni TaxID=2493646 RepID=A0AAE0TIR0_9BIVA|nr:hypothetical protein CHS0354_009615 [Potamilus streckersoni]
MFHFGAGYYGMPGAGALGGSSFVPGTLGGGGAFGGMQGGHHASSSGGSSGGYHAVQEKPLKVRERRTNG